MKKILLITFFLNLFSSFAWANLPVYEIEIKDHKFNPSILQVKKGEKFRLIVKNLDETAEEFESEDLNREKIIQGGKKAYFIIKPLQAGTYKFFGEYNPKTAQGKIVAK